jgi:hypothetical protein
MNQLETDIINTLIAKNGDLTYRFLKVGLTCKLLFVAY